MGKTKILRKFIRDYPAAFDDSLGITHMRVIHNGRSNWEQAQSRLV